MALKIGEGQEQATASPVPGEGTNGAVGTPAEAYARRPWVLVAVLATIYMCAFVDRNILSLLVEPIKADLNVGDIEMSLLIGIAFSLFYVVLNVPAGLIIDRYGRRGIIAIAVVSWSLMTVVCGLAANYWQLFFGRLGLGVAEAFITPAAFSLIRDRVPLEKRGRAFSIFAMSPYVGGSVALVGGGALLASATGGAFQAWPLIGGLHHWQTVLVLIGSLGLPLTVLLLLLPADHRTVRAMAPLNDPFGLRESWAYMRKHGRLYGLLTAYVTTGAMLAFGTSAWLPTMMSRKFSLPISQVGFISGPISLVASISGLIVCGLLLDGLNARGKSPLLYGTIAIAISSTAATLTPLMPSQTLSWISYGVTVFFAGSFYSVGATMLSRLVPSNVMGKVTALYLMSQMLIGSGLGPTIIAGVAHAFFTGPMAIAYALSLYSAVVGISGVILAITLTAAMRPRNSAP